MTIYQKRRAALYLVLTVGGATLLAMDVHRIALAWAWPFITAFWDTYISF